MIVSNDALIGFLSGCGIGVAGMGIIAYHLIKDDTETTKLNDVDTLNVTADSLRATAPLIKSSLIYTKTIRLISQIDKSILVNHTNGKSYLSIDKWTNSDLRDWINKVFYTTDILNNLVAHYVDKGFTVIREQTTFDKLTALTIRWDLEEEE